MTAQVEPTTSDYLHTYTNVSCINYGLHTVSFIYQPISIVGTETELHQERRIHLTYANLVSIATVED